MSHPQLHVFGLEQGAAGAGPCFAASSAGTRCSPVTLTCPFFPGLMGACG